MLPESTRRVRRLLPIRWKWRKRSPREKGFVRGAVWTVSLMVLALLLPLLLVAKGNPVQDSRSASGELSESSARQSGSVIDEKIYENPAATEPYIRVFLSGADKIEKIPLEQYVRGVVAAEMPIEFELEALKAQAIASRTYIVRRLEQGLAGKAEQGADVNDTISYQAYLSLEELSKKDAESIKKLNRAVNETSGQIITYKDKPIEALFFSTSNGYTENAEDYWNNPVPYLKSVESLWDAKISPRYKSVTEVSPDDFLTKLNIPVQAVPAFGAGSNQSKSSTAPSLVDMKVIDRTAGKRIGELKIGSYAFTGREFREKLELRSSDVEWKSKNGMIELTTYGYGHGVGMSQYGAQGMALEGAEAKSIITHYYQGVKLTTYSVDR